MVINPLKMREVKYKIPLIQNKYLTSTCIRLAAVQMERKSESLGHLHILKETYLNYEMRLDSVR